MLLNNLIIGYLRGLCGVKAVKTRNANKSGNKMNWQLKMLNKPPTHLFCPSS